MAEQKTAQQAMREQYKAAEDVAENVVRVWSELTATTVDYTFDAVEKSVRLSQEARTQADKLVQGAFESYRRVYQDGMKSWQGYVQGVSDVFTRSN